MDYKEILSNIIEKKLRHPYYDRLVKLAKEYKAHSTGEGLGNYLKKFTRREDDVDFKARLELTEFINSALVGNSMMSFQKVPRSTSIVRNISYKDDKEGKKKEELFEILSKFYGEEDFNKYMNQRIINLNETDPNTWIFFEWDEFDNKRERLQPYPFEAGCESVIYWHRKNNTYKYVVVDIEEKIGRKIYHKFTLYSEDQTFQMIEIPDNPKLISLPEKYDLVTIGVREYAWVELEPHNLGCIPAIRAGYLPDLLTKDETYVSPYHRGMCYLRKLLKTVSEMDMTAALHAFPQKISYKEPCNAEGCYEGKNTQDGSKCKVCGGTGVQVHTSAQDIITIAMPKRREEILNLSELIHCEYPPIDCLEWQTKYIEALQVMFLKTVFNSDIFTRKEINITATEKIIDFQAVYDTLYPFVESFAGKWDKSIMIIAKLTELDKNLTAKMTFDRDFQMMSQEEVIAIMKELNESNADQSVIMDYQKKLMKMIFSDNPLEYRKWEVKNTFDPFVGKKDEEVAALMSLNLITKFNKVLNANYGYIFDEIEREKGDEFYVMDENLQYNIIKEKVEAIIKVLDGENVITVDIVE